MISRGSGGPSWTWSNDPGDHYPEHRHDYDKIVVAASGSITFRLAERGESIELGTGDRLDLPAGTLHGAEVGPSGVSCRETHLEAGSLSEVRLHAGLLHRPETAARHGA